MKDIESKLKPCPYCNSKGLFYKGNGCSFIHCSNNDCFYCINNFGLTDIELVQKWNDSVIIISLTKRISNRHWFTKDWWKYILERPFGNGNVNFLKTIWCRIKGHPYGVIWFNPHGYEPDMHCKNCGDDLG